MTPCQGNTLLLASYQQPPRLRYVPLKGFLKWYMTPHFSSQRKAEVVQRQKDIVSCVLPGAKGQGNCQNQRTQTFLRVNRNTHFFTLILDCKQPTE